MSPETREIVDISINAISAIGTLAAVMVALHLARQDQRERIKVRYGIRNITTVGDRTSPLPEVVSISITNITHRPITISALGWRIGIFRKQTFIQLPDTSNPLSSKMPQKIDYGDCASYLYDTKRFFEHIDKMAPSISSFLPSLTKRFMFVVVSTSGSGRDFRIRVERPLADRLYSEAKKKRPIKSP